MGLAIFAACSGLGRNPPPHVWVKLPTLPNLCFNKFETNQARPGLFSQNSWNKTILTKWVIQKGKKLGKQMFAVSQLDCGFV